MDFTDPQVPNNWILRCCKFHCLLRVPYILRKLLSQTWIWGASKGLEMVGISLPCTNLEYGTQANWSSKLGVGCSSCRRWWGFSLPPGITGYKRKSIIHWTLKTHSLNIQTRGIWITKIHLKHLLQGKIGCLGIEISTSFWTSMERKIQLNHGKPPIQLSWMRKRKNLRPKSGQQKTGQIQKGSKKYVTDLIIPIWQD